MVSVNNAIRKGLKVLYVSLGIWLTIFFLGFFGTIIYSEVSDSELIMHPLLLIVLSFVLSFVMLFVVWGFLITRWKIWAYENVHDIIAFQQRAEEYYLLYRNKKTQNFFEIKTTKQRARLKELEKRFDEPRPKEEVVLSEHLQENLEVRTRLSSIIILSLSALCTLGVGVFILAATPNYLYLLIGIALIFLAGWLFVKQILPKRIKFIIEKEGILFMPDENVNWSQIKEVTGHLKYISIEYTDKYGQSVLKNFDLRDMNKNFLEIEDAINSFRNNYKEDETE